MSTNSVRATAKDVKRASVAVSAKSGQILEHSLLDFLQLDMSLRVVTGVKLRKAASNDVVRTFKVMPASEVKSLP